MGLNQAALHWVAHCYYCVPPEPARVPIIVILLLKFSHFGLNRSYCCCMPQQLGVVDAPALQEDGLLMSSCFAVVSVQVLIAFSSVALSLLPRGTNK